MNEPTDRKLVKTIVEYYRYPDANNSLLMMKNEIPWRYHRKNNRFHPTTKGGFTKAILIFEGGAMKLGWARCSKKDNFDYRLGRKIAIGRANASDFIEDDCSPDDMPS